jgi:hypothetical protein
MDGQVARLSHMRGIRDAEGSSAEAQVHPQADFRT